MILFYLLFGHTTCRLSANGKQTEIENFHVERFLTSRTHERR